MLDPAVIKERRLSFPLPGVGTVDFGSPEEVEGYGHLLFSLYRNSGGFGEERPGAAVRKVREEAEKWVKVVEERIGECDARGIQDCLSMYGTVHRLAFSKAPRPGYVDGWMSRALDRMARGESARREVFMHWIGSLMMKETEKVDRRHYEWYMAVARRWEEEYLSGGMSEGEGDKGEMLARIDYLLRDRLDHPYEMRTDGMGLALTGLSLVREITADRSAGDGEMRQAASFLLQLPAVDPAFRWEEPRVRLLARLSESPTLNRFSRRAYRLDLENEASPH